MYLQWINLKSCCLSGAATIRYLRVQSATFYIFLRYSFVSSCKETWLCISTNKGIVVSVPKTWLSSVVSWALCVQWWMALLICVDFLTITIFFWYKKWNKIKNKLENPPRNQTKSSKQANEQTTNKSKARSKEEPYNSTRWSTRLHICSDNFIAY